MESHGYTPETQQYLRNILCYQHANAFSVIKIFLKNDKPTWSCDNDNHINWHDYAM
jgi:hypothetical protein